MLKTDLQIAYKNLIKDNGTLRDNDNDLKRRNKNLREELSKVEKVSDSRYYTIQRLRESNRDCKNLALQLETRVFDDRGGQQFDGYGNKTLYTEPKETEYKSLFYELLGCVKISTLGDTVTIDNNTSDSSILIR